MYANRVRKEVFKSLQKLSKEHVGSRRLSNSKLQVIWPTTENSQQPNIECLSCSITAGVKVLPAGNVWEYAVFQHDL